jgi:HSP20 family molecular chaperone IbpA
VISITASSPDLCDPAFAAPAASISEWNRGRAGTDFSQESEEIIMATSVAVQRTEEKPVAITPAENLMDRVNQMSQAIMQRAYNIFEGNGRRFGHDLEDWLKAETDILYPVRVSLVETDDSLEVKAEVPGFNEKEIEVSVEPRRLTITGKRETETKKEEKKSKTVYSEFCSNQILRIVDLPASVDAEKTIATLKNGVLQLTMPKVAKAKTLEIKPKAA